MKVQSVLIPAVALAAGLALGYCFNAGEVSPEAPAEKKPKAARQIADAGDAELVKSLRRQVRELERRLAEKGAPEEEAKGEKVEEAPRRRGEGRMGPDWGEIRARMEQWKKDNPEEFARMDARRKEFMAQHAQKTQSKLDFLASIDTSTMSKKAKETHEQLQQQLAKREDLLAKLQDPETADADRGRIFHEMREVERSTRELGEQERENLLLQAAESLGCTGAETTDFVDTISSIYEVTSGGHGFGPGGPMGMGGGRGGRH